MAGKVKLHQRSVLHLGEETAEWRKQSNEARGLTTDRKGLTSPDPLADILKQETDQYRMGIREDVMAQSTPRRCCSGRMR